jgi:uracil-DNA glycosylase
MHINVMNEKTEDNRPLKKSEIKANLKRLAADVKTVEADFVIALGKTAAEALSAIGAKFYEMPHPSGLNRLLNDKEFVEGKVKGLLEYCSNRPSNS